VVARRKHARVLQVPNFCNPQTFERAAVNQPG
jgi:hypothetical protein